MPARRRATRLLLPAFSVVLAASALTAVTAAPARADDYCEYQDETLPDVYGYGPSTVAVGAEGSALVKFSVDAYDECGIDDWSISGSRVFAYKSGPSDTVYAFLNSYAGRSSVDVSVYDQAYNNSKKRFSFRLLRKAYWSGFNASEPVRKGHSVTLSATLKRADWDTNRNVGYGYRTQRAQVQFKARGADRWTTIKTLTIGKGGKLRTSVKASGRTGKDGSYRFAYAGNGVTSAANSPADYVDVR